MNTILRPLVVAGLGLAALVPTTAHAILTYDLRAVSITPGGGTIADAKTIYLGPPGPPGGTVITLELWVVVTGLDANPANEQFQSFYGSLVSSPGTVVNLDTGVTGNQTLSNQFSTNQILGDLSNTLLPTFQTGAFNHGPILDLDGDGDLDAGGNNPDGSSSYIVGRAASLQDGTGLAPADFHTLANGREFKVSVATFAIESAAPGASIGINYVVPARSSALGENARSGFVTDGVTRNGADANLAVGAPVVIGPIPEPGSAALLAAAALPLLLRRQRGLRQG